MTNIITKIEREEILHVSAISGLVSFRSIEVECFETEEEMKDRAFRLLDQENLNDIDLIKDIVEIFSKSYINFINILESLSKDLKGMFFLHRIGRVQSARIDILEETSKLRNNLDDCLYDHIDSGDSAWYRQYKNDIIYKVYNNYEKQYMGIYDYLNKNYK